MNLPRPFPMRPTTRIACLIIALPPLAIVVWLFFVPFLSSAHLSLLRDDQWSLRNYYLVWRLYKFDVLYTLWIAFVALTLLAVFGAMFEPASSAALPNLVEPRSASRAWIR